MVGHTDCHSSAFNSTYTLDSQHKHRQPLGLAEREAHQCGHTYNFTIALPASQTLLLIPQVSYSLAGTSWYLLAKGHMHSHILNGERFCRERVEKIATEKIGQIELIRCRVQSGRHKDHSHFSCYQPLLYLFCFSWIPFPCTFPHQLA